MPAKTGALLAVGGRDARDVWITGDDRVLLRWDGARLAAGKAPSCPSRYELNFGPGNVQRFVLEPSYQHVLAAPREIVLSGPRREIGSRGDWRNDVEARVRAGGGVTCVANAGIYPPVEHVVAGALARVQIYPRRELTLDGRRVPLPADAFEDPLDVAGKATDDLWIWNGRGGRLWRGNGVAWFVVPTGLDGIEDVWLDETGAPWVLGVVKDRGEALLRWDEARGALRPLPLPRDTGAALVRGTSARDVWVLGSKAVLQWDGRAFRRAESPIGTVNDAWVAPSGELWMVGGDRARKVKTEDGTGPAGAAFRLPAPEGAKP